jgi:citrate synthase
MLDAIGSAEQAQAWTEAELAAGRRIMGFGHRIYRVRDPRADVLKQTLQQLQQAQMHETAAPKRAEAIEAVIRDVLHRHKPNRPLDTNVEFYTALLLDALGFERSAFTAVFALGRVLGWLAHALEQQATGRLIRPQSVYIGPRPGK